MSRTITIGRSRRSVIPGFGITLGTTIFWLSLIVLIPLAALFLKSADLSFSAFVAAVTSRRVLHAFELSFGLSFAAALVNFVVGSLRRLGARALPLSRPAHARCDRRHAVCAADRCRRHNACKPLRRDRMGRTLLAPLGITVAFTPLGIFVALVFIGLPFVVRTVQPVLEDIDQEFEEAAASLGATRWTDVAPRGVSELCRRC